MTCREEDIPEVGDHHVYEIVDQSIIVTRTGENEFKAFINSCLHRGRILRDNDGHAEEFVCPFHGATWDINGNFKGIPCKWDFSHLDEKDMSLPQVKIGTWGGFIFINFDENCSPSGRLPQPIARAFLPLPTARLLQRRPCSARRSVQLESRCRGLYGVIPYTLKPTAKSSPLPAMPTPSTTPLVTM